MILTCCQIKNNLNEWVTGEHIDVAFTAAAYKTKYRTHLKHITDLRRKCVRPRSFC